MCADKETVLISVHRHKNNMSIVCLHTKNSAYFECVDKEKVLYLKYLDMEMCVFGDFEPVDMCEHLKLFVLSNEKKTAVPKFMFV